MQVKVLAASGQELPSWAVWTQLSPEFWQGSLATEPPQ